MATQGPCPLAPPSVEAAGGPGASKFTLMAGAFLGPVTALAYSPSYRVLCAGSGAELRAYDTKRCALLTSCRGFSGHRIQGTSLWAACTLVT